MSRFNSGERRASSVPSTTKPVNWAALPVLLAGSFMVVLDFFIVAVALPAMAVELGAGESSLEWVVAGYGLTFAIFLIVAGRLGDEFGRRRMFTIGLAAFTATSLLCGLAETPAMLVVARLAQGAAAAIMMPQVLSIIAVTYRGETYAKAVGFYGMVAGLAAVGGQVIGGALVETDLAGLGWRACFLINIPVGLAALIAVPRLVEESRAPHRARIDIVGALVLGAGLVAVLMPLIQGRQQGWPAWTWISLAAAPVLLTAFVARQQRMGANGGALLDLRLFGERTFSAGLATQFALASVQASFFVYLALYLQQGRGLNALEAGLVFTVLALAYVLASGRAPQLTVRYGRAVVAWGGTSLAAGTVAMALAVHEVGSGGSLVALVPGLVLVGIGIGLCFTPLTQIVLGNVDPAWAGAASGMLSTTQQVGFAVGVAITGLIFFGVPAGEVARAFELSLWQMSAFAIEIVVFSRLLPRPNRSAGIEAAEASAVAG